MAMPKSVRRTKRSNRIMSPAAITMMSTCKGVKVRPPPPAGQGNEVREVRAAAPGFPG